MACCATRSAKLKITDMLRSPGSRRTPTPAAVTSRFAGRYRGVRRQAVPGGLELPDNAVHSFNTDVLEHGINELLRNTGQPVAMRFSFGFPVSNLGDTGDEVRFTIGIEGAAQLQTYVDVLAYVNGKLAGKFDEIQRTGASAMNRAPGDTTPAVAPGDARLSPLADHAERLALLKDITKDIHDIPQLQSKLRDLLKPEPEAT